MALDAYGNFLGESEPAPAPNPTSILAGGGGGGTAVEQVYVGRAPADPDDPTKAAVSFPAGGGTLSQYDPDTGWV